MNDKFRIIAFCWTCNNINETPDLNYQLIKDSGVNTIDMDFFRYEDYNMQTMNKIRNAGLEVIYQSNWWYMVRENPTSQEIQRMLNKLKSLDKDDLVVGFYGWDEPSISKHNAVKSHYDRIKTATSKPVIVNRLPNYATDVQLGTSNYNQYISTFNDCTDITMGDYYPILSTLRHGTDRYLRYDKDGMTPITQWYQYYKAFLDNRVLKNSDMIYYWIDVTETPISLHPRMSLESLRIQCYSALLGGAKGIDYYTYVDRVDDIKNVYEGRYRYSPMDRSGNTNEAYFIIKDFNNSEFIKVADFFFESDVDNMTVRTERYDDNRTNPFLYVSNEAFISEITGKDNSKYYAIQNFSIDKYTDMTVLMDKGSSILNKDMSLENLHPFREYKIKCGDLLIVKM